MSSRRAPRWWSCCATHAMRPRRCSAKAVADAARTRTPRRSPSVCPRHRPRCRVPAVPPRRCFAARRPAEGTGRPSPCCTRPVRLEGGRAEDAGIPRSALACRTAGRTRPYPPEALARTPVRCHEGRVTGPTQRRSWCCGSPGHQTDRARETDGSARHPRMSKRPPCRCRHGGGTLVAPAPSRTYRNPLAPASPGTYRNRLRRPRRAPS